MNKLKLFGLTALFNAFIFTLTAQTFHDIVGVHGLCRSDDGRCVKQTSDGGFVMIANEYFCSTGYSDILLVKFGAAGDTIWSHIFGGVQDDVGRYVQQTSDGGYILIGSTQCAGQGMHDMYVIKTNANGDSLWTRTYGGAGEDRGTYVQQTNDGGYMMYGSSASFNSGAGAAAWIVKTDNAGLIQWTKNYDAYGNYGTCGALQTTDNGYIMQADDYDNSGNVNVLLLRTNVSGDTLWTRAYGGPSDEIGAGIVQTADGGFVFAAKSREPNNLTPEILVVKINSVGDTLWTKMFGGTNQDVPYSIQSTSDGGFIVAGESWSFSTYNSVYLLKIDANGDLQWSTIMSGIAYRYAFFASQNSDGSYIVAGTTSDWGTASGDYDAYVIRTDAFGQGFCADGNAATMVRFSDISVSNLAIQVVTGGVEGSTPLPAYRNCVFEQHCASPLSSSTIATHEFQLQPDPGNGSFKIISDHLINQGTVRLYNVIGEKVNEEVIRDFVSGDFDFSQNRSGIYFLEIFDGKKTFTLKVIIQ